MASIAGASSRPISVKAYSTDGGGVSLVFHMLSATVLAPKLGVENFVGLILIGQLVMAAIIDQTGWFGMST